MGTRSIILRLESWFCSFSVPRSSLCSSSLFSFRFAAAERGNEKTREERREQKIRAENGRDKGRSVETCYSPLKKIKKKRREEKKWREENPSLFHASIVVFSSPLRFFPDMRHTGRTKSRSV
jgi:hypothetical protein